MQPAPGDRGKFVCDEVSQKGSKVEQAGEVGEPAMGLLVVSVPRRASLKGKDHETTIYN
jgi:hypothetical protein